MMKFVLVILVLAAAIYDANSLCNTCSAVTNLACVSNTRFAACVGGRPTGDSIACPSGSVCTADAQVCSTDASKSSCTRCGTCDANNAFACKSYNSFALCHGSTQPDSVSYNCSGSLACSIDSPQICVDPSVTGIGGTCPSVVTPTTTTTTTAAPTTTPNPTTSPQAYCASRGTEGNYDIATDATCKKYILCKLSSGSWVGNIYECPGSTFFNASTGKCTTARPTRCT